MRAPAGAWVFREGLACEGYPIVVSGRIRVQKTGANGREIALYRVGPGETCVITTACLMRDAAYDAEAVAETDVTAKVLPKAVFRELLATSESFRDFVFRSFSTRISHLLARIEEVAFERIDRRLASAPSRRRRPRMARWLRRIASSPSSWARRGKSSAASSRTSSEAAGSSCIAAVFDCSMPRRCGELPMTTPARDFVADGAEQRAEARGIVFLKRGVLPW